MSDVSTRSRPATYGAVPVNRDLYLRACADKGATTADQRANLFGITQKMAYLYEYGHIAPNLLKAQRIASALDLKVDDLWPAPPLKKNRRAA